MRELKVSIGKEGREKNTSAGAYARDDGEEGGAGCHGWGWDEVLAVNGKSLGGAGHQLIMQISNGTGIGRDKLLSYSEVAEL